MTEIPNSKQYFKQYDLEERTFQFSKKCRDFLNKLQKTVSKIEDSKQLARSSGSQAANYIEANESLSKKDFIYRIRICRKETKETCLWLRLCDPINSNELLKEQNSLSQEAIELRKIFSSILDKSSYKIV